MNERSTALAAALLGVRAAARVEQLARGLTRNQRRHLGEVVDHRILEAVQAGASSAQIAQELQVGISRAQERVLRAKRAVRPAAEMQAPNVWREVPRCDRPAPPPWPVSARCRVDLGHAGPHQFHGKPCPSAGSW